MRYVIGNPKDYYLYQGDNELHPWVTCFPTSMAMCLLYILTLLGMTKSDIGIQSEMQIEDFITQDASTQEMRDWMAKFVGTWTSGYNPWTVAAVEEKIFDKLMNPLGFDAAFIAPISYEKVCERLTNNGIPAVVFGNFKKYHKTVRGHVNCLVGYDTDKRDVIVNDPYMNILTGNPDGCCAKYPWDEIYANDSYKNGWLLEVKKT